MLHERPMSYLYEVGIQGGIRRAADMLGINPSVISRQIAQLERALELPLLERQGRNVVLTEAGRLLAEDYYCGEVIIYAWMDRRRENSEKPYGTRLGAGQAVSARLVGK